MLILLRIGVDFNQYAVIEKLGVQLLAECVIRDPSTNHGSDYCAGGTEPTARSKPNGYTLSEGCTGESRGTTETSSHYNIRSAGSYPLPNNSDRWQRHVGNRTTCSIGREAWGIAPIA